MRTGVAIQTSNYDWGNVQNEPNFQKSQMNVNNLLTKDYDKRTLGQRGKNEPKTNPIYPCIASGEAGTNPIYENAKN
jgi:hypothetical protein